MTRDDSDVRLIAEILARAHSIIRSLGLDPSNATAEEIYQSLMAIAPKVDKWALLSRLLEWVLLDVDGQVISFNPIDIINNYHCQLPLGSSKQRMVSEVWDLRLRADIKTTRARTIQP